MTETDYIKEKAETIETEIRENEWKLHFDHYILTEKIGEGGLFYVFKGYDEDLGPEKSVAIKVPRFQEAVEPLREHKNLLIRLEHPNVPEIYDAEFPEDKERLPYVAEELCQGTLADKIKAYKEKQQFMPEEEFRDHTAQLFTALAHVHSKDIIHKDIKPQNILIGKDGKIKLTDFNLSSATKAEAPKLEESIVYSFITCVTPSSSTPIEGITDRYASPEQRRWALGEDVKLDTRTDVYSLGVVLFEMLTNEAAAGSDSDPTLYNPDAPDLKAFFHKALRPKREDRHQSIDEMREDFEGSETSLEQFTRIAYAYPGDYLYIIEVKKKGNELDTIRTDYKFIDGKNAIDGICFSPDGKQIAVVTNDQVKYGSGNFRYMLTRVKIYDLNKKELTLLFQEEHSKNEWARNPHWADDGIYFYYPSEGSMFIDRFAKKTKINSSLKQSNQKSPGSPHEVVEVDKEIRIISTNPGDYSFQELGPGRLPAWSPIVYERIVKKPKPGLFKRFKRKLFG